MGNPFVGIFDDLFRGGNGNQGSGAISQWLGDISAGGLKRLTGSLPGELANVFQKGMENAGFDKLFADTFSSAKDIIMSKYYKFLLDTLKNVGDVAAKSWEKADQAAYNYGKRLGATAAQVRGLRDDIIKLNDASAKFGINYGKTLDEVIKLQSDFASAVGRSIRLTNDQLKDIAALSAVVGDDMAVKFTAQLENFGLSTTQAGQMMTQMFNKSVKQGISLEVYAKNVTEHLNKAQQYTFKRGVEGLAAMAEKAAKMKMDMEQAFRLAEKASTVESAVDVSAQLQVLGGEFTQFADPLALLHDSLLDVEGLNDRLAGLVSRMGYFDKNTGQIQIAAQDKIRLKTAANAMGVDYNALIESATHQAKRNEIEAQMSGLGNIPEQYKELLMNTAQFQNGVAGIRGADGTFKKLASLNGNDLKMLAENSKSDSDNIRDIARMLRGMTDMREGMEKEKENERATMYAEQAEAIKGIYKDLGESKEALQQLVKLELRTAVMDNLVMPAWGLTKKGFGFVGDLVGKSVGKKEHGGLIKTHSEGDVITNGDIGKEYLLNSAQYGEFIVNKKSTAQHLGLLKAINADKTGSLKIKQNEEGTSSSFLSNNMGFAMTGLNVLSMNRQLDGMLFNPDKFFNQRNPFTDTLRSLNENLEKQRWTYQNVSLKSSGRKIVSNEIKRLENRIAAAERLENTYNARTAKWAKGIKMGTTIGGGAIAGIGALASSIQGYRADDTFIMDKGKAVGGTIGATVGATAGAALGAIAGPVGMMIGSAAGQFIGKHAGEAIGKGNQFRRTRKFNEFQSEIASASGRNQFARIQGNFSVAEQRHLKNALNDGALFESELSEDLLEKFKRSGNEHLIVNKKYAKGGLLKGNSHAFGGININNEAEGGEFIINKASTAKSMGLLNKINEGSVNDSNIRPSEPMGKQMKVKESYPTNNQNRQVMKMEPIDININGTIKLDTGDKTFDISKELFNNPTLINKLTDIITKQINIDEYGALNRKEYTRRYSSI